MAGDEPTPASIRGDLEAVARIEAVPTILELIAGQTGLGLTLVARVTPGSWTACAVHDRIAFGLGPGDRLDVATTLCNEVRATERAIIIEHASREPEYCGHPTPKMYGFESYVSVPLRRRNGEYFGTLCGLDPAPRTLRDERTQTTFDLFAQLIALQLEAVETLDRSRAALEEEQGTAALREQFMAVLGHDLRNPLSAIRTGAHLLQRQGLPAAAGAVVDRIARSARRIELLADDMLDLTRARLGSGIPLVIEEVDDLGARLRHVVDELASVHPARTIHVTVDDVGVIRCDRRRIEQVVSNLIANAVQHGDPAAPIELDVRGSAGAVTLRVRNRGPVLPAAVLERIFEPFYRSGRGPTGGLGLGLFIVATIARAHGGAVAATSTERDGTTFTVTLPRTPRAPGT